MDLMKATVTGVLFFVFRAVSIAQHSRTRTVQHNKSEEG
jgi:hypothetical protein